MRIPFDAGSLMLLALAASTPLAAQTSVATMDAIRLRGGPSATAAAVRTLDIATPLTVEGSAAGEWVRVRAADGARGWVRRDLTVPYDAASPLPALRRITERSLAQERAPFATRARLVNVLTGAAGTGTPAARAELSLLRLRALQKALDEHASGGGGSAANPLRDGRIRADSSELVYGEPQGQWYVAADRFWALHDRSRGLPIAESIAWHASTQDLPGECESDPTCIFGVAEMTAGRYLALYPRGAHATAARGNLATLLGYVEELTRDRSSHAQYCTKRGAEYTLTPRRVTALTAAASGSARTASLLRTLASRCV
jgi:hypothetical protein